MITKIITHSIDIYKLILNLLDDKSFRYLTMTCKLLHNNVGLIKLKNEYPIKALMTPWIIESIYCHKATFDMPVILNDIDIIGIHRMKCNYDKVIKLTLHSCDKKITRLPKSLQILNILFMPCDYNTQQYIYKLVRDMPNINIILPKGMEYFKFLRGYKVSFVSLDSRAELRLFDETDDVFDRYFKH